MSDPILIGFNGDIDSQLLAILLTKQGFKVRGVYYSVNTSLLSILPTQIQSKVTKDISVLKDKAKDLSIEIEIIDVTDQFISDVVDSAISSRLQFKYVNYSQLFLEFLVSCSLNYSDTFALGYYIKFLVLHDRPSILMHSDFEMDQSTAFCHSNLSDLKNFIFPLGELSAKERSKLIDNFELKNTVSNTTEAINLDGVVANSLVQSIEDGDTIFRNFDLELSDYNKKTHYSFDVLDHKLIRVDSSMFEFRKSTVECSSKPLNIAVKLANHSELLDALLFSSTNSQFRVEFSCAVCIQLGQLVAIYQSGHKNAKLIGSGELFNILPMHV